MAAGYCVYGPQTTLVLTVGDGVAMFTLDREQGSFVLIKEHVQIPPDTKEFAINMSNMRHWAEPVKRYVDECLAGKEGPRGKDFKHALGGQHGGPMCTASSPAAASSCTPGTNASPRRPASCA